MLAGASKSRRMPREFAGSAMITIDPSSADITIASIVFDNAIHL